MLDFERPTRHVQELNLIPLIDVVFHLLIFVMFTSTFVVSESMELSLPSGHATKTVAADITRIQIAPSGDLLVNQSPMAGADLSNFLADKLGQDPNARIAIFTTPGVTVQQLVSVLDTTYLTGGRNVQVEKVD